MNRIAGKALGILGVGLALSASCLGAAGYYYANQRHEQARAVPLRLERGQTDLAERHQRGAKVLGELSAALVQLGYCAAILALVAGGWPVLKGAAWSRWVAVVTVVLLAVGVAFGIASRPLLAQQQTVTTLASGTSQPIQKAPVTESGR